MLSIIWFLLFGLIVGLIARALMPGKQPMSLVMTTGLGVLGSLIGGFLGSLLSRSEPTRVHSAGIIGSVIGALALLALMGAWQKRHQHHTPA